MSPAGLAARAQLIRWLGPGARPDRAPRGPRRLAVTLPDAPAFEARIFTPARPHGAVFLLPGLHYAGPDDPRLDRLCRILAATGRWVFAPRVPELLALSLGPDLIAQSLQAFDAAAAWPGRPPGPLGVMSISFGSLPALHLAAERPASVGRLLTFGGFADWRAVMRFALTGGRGVKHDPLNRPVVFLNLIEQLAPPADRAPLAAAWRAYCAATWGRPALRIQGAWQAEARRLALSLPERLRPLFLDGCGVGPRDPRAVEAALDARGDPPWLAVAPVAARVRCPVDLVHGRDDDVVPHPQLEALAALLTRAKPVRCLSTGLYGHTQAAAGRGLGLLIREARTLLRVVDALARLGDPVEAARMLS